MLTNSNIQPETFQLLGQILRINHSVTTAEVTDPMGYAYTNYSYYTAVTKPDATRSELIEAIIASKLTPGAETALINNQADKPEAYAEYQAFRTEAKLLADNWLQMPTE